ncbi:hypothetical protein RD792_007339 [Penstemon davidsonii]|uniref:Myb-like domain-containing protein n=1 Tax=Penstemon davidsonii TaxID=160366 RepID=A0ABR0D756_9LAMI|nr:hypothetical protein RD792_007339 [Penstemon davidsonii]
MVNTDEDDFETQNSIWSWEEDKQFENCLIEFPEDCPDRWEKIAAKIGNKSSLEVEQHYDVLVNDVMAIEAGLIESPEYVEKDTFRSSETPMPEKKQSGVQRKAARPWTPDEHR